MSENDSPWAHPACFLFMGPENTIDDLTIFYNCLGKEQNWYSYQKLCGPKSPQSCSRLISFQSLFLPNCVCFGSCLKSILKQADSKQSNTGTSQVAHWLRIAPNAEDLGSIPDGGTRSHVLQLVRALMLKQRLKSPHATTKTTAVKQINKIKINI